MLNAKAKKEAMKFFRDGESKLLDSFRACIKLQKTFNEGRERASHQISLSLQIINSVSVKPKKIDTFIRQTTISLDKYKSCITDYKLDAISLPKDSSPQRTIGYDDNYNDNYNYNYNDIYDDDSGSGLGGALIAGAIGLLIVGGLLAYETNQENKRLSQEYIEQAKRYEKARGLLQGLEIIAEDKVKELESEISHLSDMCSQTMAFRGASFQDLSKSDQDMLIALARETGIVAALLTFDFENQIHETLEALKKLELKSEGAIKSKVPSTRQNDVKRINKGDVEDDFPIIDLADFPVINPDDFPVINPYDFPVIDPNDFPVIDSDDIC